MWCPYERGTAYQTREPAVNLDSLTLFYRNIAADCAIASIDVLAILFKWIQLFFHEDIDICCAVGVFLNDPHDEDLKLPWLSDLVSVDYGLELRGE
jgi:hypothetical protein